MSKARVDQIKNKISAVSGNPLMSSIGDASTLRHKLEIEIQSYYQAISHATQLSTHLAQSNAQLAKIQKQQSDLETKQKKQEELVAKVNSYLSDFQNPVEPNLSLEEEAQKLAGELQELTME